MLNLYTTGLSSKVCYKINTTNRKWCTLQNFACTIREKRILCIQFLFCKHIIAIRWIGVTQWRLLQYKNDEFFFKKNIFLIKKNLWIFFFNVCFERIKGEVILWHKTRKSKFDENPLTSVAFYLDIAFVKSATLVLLIFDKQFFFCLKYCFKYGLK